MLLLFVGLPVGYVFLTRSARIKGTKPTQLGRCQICSQQGPLIQMKLHQNTGMLIVRQHKTFDALTCASCGRSAFWKIQLHTMFLGWWGTISFVITPFFLLNNWFYWLGTFTLPPAAAASKVALSEYDDYALGLLKTKDEDTVVEVLCKQTGASAEDVRAYVKTLYPKMAA